MGFAQPGARFGRIDFCGLAIGPAGQKSPVNQRIDEPGNRRRRQVKMLAQLFTAADVIIIDQKAWAGDSPVRRNSSSAMRVIILAWKLAVKKRQLCKMDLLGDKIGSL